MLIDNVNLNHLRIFECVYRTRSMTTAAQELHLTQSGVSQHIKSLEDVLGVKLFDRIKQRIIPTSVAADLFKTCSNALYGIEHALTELKGGEKQLSGSVAIGMPIEFGNNLVMPKLSEFSRTHSRVRFALRYGFATEMNELILRGEMDFAFVDEFGLDKRIHAEPVYDELLYLCVTPEYLKKNGLGAKENRKFFESLEYVDYQPGAPVLKAWFEHHLGVKSMETDVKVTVMDVQGVARLILTGLGAGVLPGHLLSKLEAEGQKLHKFKGCGKVMKNSISVAYLPERTSSVASKAVFSWLLQSLKH